MENYDPKKRYHKQMEDDEEYKFEELDKDQRSFENRDLIPREIIKEVTRIKKQAMPKMEDEPIEPLKRVSPELIGSLFERLDFLKKRIEELEEEAKTREELHRKIIEEIEADVKEKTSLMSRLVDVDEIRNFKMDISILRKENRREEIEFWKDMMELKSELRNLIERYETEKNIVEIFKKVKAAASS